MSQQEVLEVLENESRPLSCREICEFLNDNNDTGRPKIGKELRQLLKYHEINSFWIDRKLAKKILKRNIKKRIRVYYIEK